MAVEWKRTGSTSLELTFVTALPPSEVYAYLSDFEKHCEWVPDIVAMEKTSDGPAGVGTTYRATEAMKEGGGMKAPTFCEITALEPPRFIEWTARTKETRGPMAMRSRWSFTIEPEGEGSRVTQAAALLPPGIWSKAFLRIFLPLADAMGGLGASPKNVRRHIENLERKLAEQAAAAAPA
jgi:uncharacterized protein YndB with AHSA1/START domain